ncbi:MAG: PAS domain S-box protein [Syntrophales bacterium]|nr:PAS domain S-box protein [Syntrophales bacterium]
MSGVLYALPALSCIMQQGFFSAVLFRAQRSSKIKYTFRTNHELLAENAVLKRSIEELKSTEARYRKLFERSSDAIFLVEKSTGRYLDANIAALELVGQSLAEIKSLTTHDISPRNAAERLQKISANDETLNFGKVAYVRPDGTKRQTLLHTVSLDEKTIFGIAHDITEIKQTEKMLTFLAQCGTASGDDFFQSLARYLAETAELNFVCICRLYGVQPTVQTVALYADGKFEDNISYHLNNTPVDKISGQTVYCFFENICKVLPHNEALQDIVAESCIGATLFSHSGSPIGLIALAGRSPLADPQKMESLLKLVAIRAAAELERTQYEEELTTAKAFIEAAINSLTDSLYIVRMADFTVLGANKAFTDVIGLDANAIIGKHCYELTHHRSVPCDYPHDPCPLMETLKTGQPSTMEHLHFDSTGEKHFFEVSAFPIRDKQGKIERIVHLDRDVTERKQLEEELRIHTEALEKLVEERTTELAIRNGNLEEMNTALHVLLKKREDDKRMVEELIVSNIKSLVCPYIEKMQTNVHDAKQHLLLGIIETNLNELLSPLLQNILQFNLTPQEVHVASMVKEGKSTKEIAEVLGVETSTIDAHRNRIRKKLVLSRNINLQSKLQSLL